MDEIIAKIKVYLEIINPNIEDNELLDFVINEVIDRVQIYLNTENVPIKFGRILASVVDNSLKKCLKNIEISTEDSTATDQVISSLSDNGQSIHYANQIKQYFTTASDEEIFSGFTALLSRYRRVKVVYPKTDD